MFFINDLIAKAKQSQSKKIPRILPTSMEVSTATISACTVKSLIVRQPVALLGMMNWLEDSMDLGNALYIIDNRLCYSHMTS